MTNIVTPADRKDIINSQVCAEVAPHQLDQPVEDEVISEAVDTDILRMFTMQKTLRLESWEKCLISALSRTCG